MFTICSYITIFKSLLALVLLLVSFEYIDWYLRESPDPGDRLNKKDGLTRYGNSHVKDKTS